MSLLNARLRARQANPFLIAARLDTSIARGRLRQSRVLQFNPTADLLAETSGDNLEAGLSQELEIFGQRGARISAARAAFERAAYSVTNTTRLITGEVDRSFYRLASAAQRAKLAEDVRILNERLADVAQKQLTEGEISRLEYNLSVVELGRARARSLATNRERHQAELDLGQLIGVSRGTRITAMTDSGSTLTVLDTLGLALPQPGAGVPIIAPSDVERLTVLALGRRPDLQERTAAVREAQAEARLAAREALPNPVLRGVIEQPTRGGERTFRPGIGVSLPFLNRNQGNRQALRAAARQAELERAGIVFRVRAEISGAVSAFTSASGEVSILESTVLAPARQNRQLAEIAYREGKIGLPVLLLIQNQAIDAELDYWSTWLAAHEALANLAEATGLNVEARPIGEQR